MNLDHARAAGRMARENGRGLDTCPLYAMGEMGRTWQAAWKSGWEAKNAEMAKVNRGK